MGGRFAAIGNTFLLKKPTLLQVQCSRSDFGYRRVRNAKGVLELVKDAKGNKVVDFAAARVRFQRLNQVLRLHWMSPAAA